MSELAFSTDGQTIATGGHMNPITLWDASQTKAEIIAVPGSVSEDGTIVLQGFSFEVDFDEFGDVVFEELSPCEIFVDPAGSFSLRWCAIPALNVNGYLKVK